MVKLPMRQQLGWIHSQGLRPMGAALLASELNIGCRASTSSPPERPAAWPPMLKFKECIRAVLARSCSCQDLAAHCYLVQHRWGSHLPGQRLHIVGGFSLLRCFKEHESHAEGSWWADQRSDARKMQFQRTGNTMFCTIQSQRWFTHSTS